MIRVTDIKKGENKMNNKRDAMGDRFKNKYVAAMPYLI